MNLKKGNHRVASRHWLLSAAAGDTKSMTRIADFYKREVVNKKEFATAFASYSNVHEGEWSIERKAAATADTRRQHSSSK